MSYVKGDTVKVRRFYPGRGKFATEKAEIVDIIPDNTLPYRLRFSDGVVMPYLERELNPENVG